MSDALFPTPIATQPAPSVVTLAGSSFAVEFTMEEVLQMLNQKDSLGAFSQSCGSWCHGIEPAAA